MKESERLRYSRSIMLEGFGIEGQQRLLDASVMIVGAGALGSVVSMYLASSGVGHIAVCDFDTIDVSNLQRQLSFTEADVGKDKTEVTCGRLRQINSDIVIEPLHGLLTADRASRLIGQYDVIVEASDNAATKYIVTDAATEAGKPCVLGGVSQCEGQVMTFVPGHASYRELFPEALADNACLPCSKGGVLGPLPGIIGSIQASEVIKIITGMGKPLIDTILTVDVTDMTFRRISL